MKIQIWYDPINMIRISFLGLKVKRFLPQIQQPQKTQMGIILVIKRFKKKSAPELVFFNEKKLRKVLIIFDEEN